VFTLHIKINLDVATRWHCLATKDKIISYLFFFEGIVLFHFYSAFQDFAFASAANATFAGKG
jgi:hypothetical protein